MPAAHSSTADVAARKRPLLRFVALLAVYLAVFYGLSATAWFREGVLSNSMRLYAGAGAMALRMLGQDARAIDHTIVSPRGAVAIHRGCDAAEPIALFIAAVLAFPAKWRERIMGVTLGVAALMALNLLRIVSLCLISTHLPRIFDLMHVDVWQAVFIFIALALWSMWALRVVTPPINSAPS